MAFTKAPDGSNFPDTAPLRLVPIDSTDPAEQAKVKQFALQVLTEVNNSLKFTNVYPRLSYYTVFSMYILLFVVGLGTAIAAIVKGLIAQNAGDAIPSLIFAGLSAASFFTLFITRPLESLERNTIFSSWLTVIMNNYWTRLMYFKDPKTIDKDLQDATDKTDTELSSLADKYATAIGKYPALTGATAGSDGGGNQPGGSNQPGGNQPG